MLAMRWRYCLSGLAVLLLTLTLWNLPASADTVFLKNGSSLDGTIVDETPQQVTIEVRGAGNISLQKTDVDRIVRTQPLRPPTATPAGLLFPSPTATELPSVELVAPTVPVSRGWQPGQPTPTPLFQPGRRRNQEQPSAEARPIPPQQSQDRPPSESQPVQAPPAEEARPEEEQPPAAEGESFPWDVPEESWEEEMDASTMFESGSPEDILAQIMAVMAAMVIGMVLFGILYYIYMSLCYQFIAIKTEVGPSWWGWIPVLGTALLLKVAQKPMWWLLLYFSPLIVNVGGNIVAFSSISQGAASGQEFGGGMFIMLMLLSFVSTIVWGLTSYFMWVGVCEARGKGKSFAQAMHLHILFIGCAFIPFVSLCYVPIGMLGWLCYLILPGYIAFSK